MGPFGLVSRMVPRGVSGGRLRSPSLRRGIRAAGEAYHRRRPIGARNVGRRDRDRDRDRDAAQPGRRDARDAARARRGRRGRRRHHVTPARRARDSAWRARLRTAMAEQPDGMLLLSERAPVSTGAAWVDVAEQLVASERRIRGGGQGGRRLSERRVRVPPRVRPPTFLWHDDDADVDLWLVEFEFARGRASRPGPARRDPPHGRDRSRGAWARRTRSTCRPSTRRARGRWTPIAEVWEEIKQRSGKRMATVTFSGFDSDVPARVRSRGGCTIETSDDPVGRADLLPRRAPDAAVGKDGADPAAAPRTRCRYRLAAPGRLAAGQPSSC